MKYNEKIAEHLKPWLKKTWAPPYVIDLNPTDRYNLECKSCWRKDPEVQKDIKKSKDYELSKEKLFRLVNEASEFGVKEIQIIGGGEPFVRRRTTVGIIKRIKKYGLIGKVTTNGTLFTPEIVKMMVEKSWDKVILSIDGPDAETNDYLRSPKGTFDKIMNTINLFEKYKEKLNREKPSISFHVVLSKINLDKIVKMVKFAIKHNIKNVSFEPLKIFSSEGKKLKISTQKEQEIFLEQERRANELVKNNQIFTNLHDLAAMFQPFEECGRERNIKDKEKNQFFRGPQKYPKLLYSYCLEPWFHMIVRVNGRTTPCCVIPELENENVKYKSLKEIWLGNEFSSFRKNILNNKLPSFCDQCNVSMITHSKNIKSFLKKSLDKNGTIEEFNINKGEYSRKVCTKPWTSIFIRRNGEIYPCCWAKKSMGNINDYHGVYETRNSPEAMRFREKMIERDFIEEFCPNPCPDLVNFKESNYLPRLKEQLSSNYLNNVYKKNLSIVKREIKEKRVKLESFPPDVQTEMSSKCNLKCLMCEIWTQVPIVELPHRVYLDIMLNIGKIGNLRLAGGEPLIYSKNIDLIEHISFVNSNHLTLNIITHFNNFPEVVEKAFKRFSGHISLHISVDASHKGLYEKIRRGANWNKLINNIKKVKKIRFIKPKNLDIVFCYTIMEKNCKDLKNFINFANKLKIHVHFASIRGNIRNQSIFKDEIIKNKVYREIKDVIEYVKNNRDFIEIEVNGLRHVLELCK